MLLLLVVLLQWLAEPARAEVTIDSGVAVGTVALVPARGDILTGGIIFARLVCRAVIEILVAQNAAPILVTQTLARQQAVAVLAARIGEALVAARARPAGAALAGSRRIALARLAAGEALGLQTVVLLALPAVEADLLAARRALVVAELVVARPTERVAAVAVVV